MKNELLRIEWADFLRPVIPDALYCFSIDEHIITGLFADSEQTFRELFRILRSPEGESGHALYFLGQPVEDPAAWYVQNCFAISNELLLFRQLTVWDNLYVNTPVARRPGTRQERHLERVFERFGLSPALVYRRIDDLTDAEKLFLMVIRAKLLGRRLVIIEFEMRKLSTQELRDFYTLLQTMCGYDMTFLILSHEPAVLERFTDKLILIENNIVTNRIRRDQYETEGTIHTAVPKAEPETPQALRYDCSFGGSSFSLESHAATTIITESGFSFAELQKRLMIEPHEPSRHAPSVCFVHDFTSEHNLCTAMPVWENLCLMKTLRPYTLSYRIRLRRHMHRYCRELFGRDVAMCAVTELDSVERQRLICHRWLLMNPDVMVCYAPFAGLDLQMMQETEDMLRRYTARGGCAVLFSHNKYQISPLSSRTVRI